MKQHQQKIRRDHNIRIISITNNAIGVEKHLKTKNVDTYVAEIEEKTITNQEIEGAAASISTKN